MPKKIPQRSVAKRGASVSILEIVLPQYPYPGRRGPVPLIPEKANGRHKDTKRPVVRVSAPLGRPAGKRLQRRAAASPASASIRPKALAAQRASRGQHEP